MRVPRSGFPYSKSLLEVRGTSHLRLSEIERRSKEKTAWLNTFTVFDGLRAIARGSWKMLETRKRARAEAPIGSDEPKMLLVASGPNFEYWTSLHLVPKTTNPTL